MNKLPSQPIATGTAEGESATRLEPVERIRLFLQRVKDEAEAKEEQLQKAQAAIARLQEEARTAANESERRGQEIDQLRADYHQELKQRSERASSLTEELLRERVADAICELRAQLENQYQSRIGHLEQALAAQERLRQESEERHRATLAETEASHQSTVADLREQHAARQVAVEQLTSEVRSQVARAYEDRIHELEEAVAAQGRGLQAAEERFAEEREALKSEAADALARSREERAAEQAAAKEVLASVRDQVGASFALQLRTLDEAVGIAKEQAQHATQQAAALKHELQDAKRAADIQLEQARATIETLKDESKEVHTRHAEQLEDLGRLHLQQVHAYEEQLELLQKSNSELRARLEMLERVLSQNDNAQHVQDLEERQEALLRREAELQERIAALAHSLGLLREVCERSTAARSIITGANKEIQLDRLFSVLE